MNSTPNYGYPKSLEITALDMVDRDVKRIEDKADANTVAIVNAEKQILITQKDVECLAKQKYNGYSKCETDKLLDGKVDKKEGFGLISTDCLQQICSNKDGITLLEQYIRELQERNDKLEAELENKADKTRNLIWHNLEFLNGYSATEPPAQYARDNNGYVQITGTFFREKTPEAEEQICRLPEGFHPDVMVSINIVQACGLSGTSWATFGWIRPDGYVTFTTITPPKEYSPSYGLSLNASFFAPQKKLP